MKFSVCIPNYNYERFLGKTVESVLGQGVDLEVAISDNASTDGSLALIRSFQDERVKVSVNACNVGFAANLDRAARMASGQVMMMLSSDDMLLPDGLRVYERLLGLLGDRADMAIVSATQKVIDAEDGVIGETGPAPELWPESAVDQRLSDDVGARVLLRPPDQLLKDCLRTMKNPFNFAATLYDRGLYEAVEGYGGGRMINPDKWFHWRCLGRASVACFIDLPLVAYRWHAGNQSAQQSQTGALKYLVDEYASTLEVDEGLLGRAGMTRAALVEAFVEYDVARHGLATLARGQRTRARRILDFGRAVYPVEVGRNRKARVLGALAGLGPLGEAVARTAYARYRRTGDPA